MKTSRGRMERYTPCLTNPSNMKQKAALTRWKNHKKIYKSCEVCGKEFTRPPSVFRKGKGKYCSQKCANGKPRSKSKHFKQNGYVYIKDYNHPRRSNQNLIAEHRLVVEKEIGRYLKKWEVVHHINHIKTDNNLQNLFLCGTELEHRKVHKIDEQFLLMFNQARYQHWDDFKEFDVTKNRQDQLQEIVNYANNNNPLGMFCVFIDTISALKRWPHPSGEGGYCLKEFDTAEKLWLAFVMKEKYNKLWNNGAKKWEIIK
jgi:hypothetical protein